MLRVAAFAVVLLGAPSVVLAQTKISGTSQCGKPDPQHVVQAGDQADHTFAIMKLKCSWPKPLEIAGFQIKEDEVTVFEEAKGNAGTDRGYVVGTMSNGDKIFVRNQGKAVLKDGVPQSSSGTWTYVGGTGKFKTIRGRGTYRGNGTTTDVKGEYQIGK
jgi:hypothetical protein